MLMLDKENQLFSIYYLHGVSIVKPTVELWLGANSSGTSEHDSPWQILTVNTPNMAPKCTDPGGSLGFAFTTLVLFQLKNFDMNSY